MRKRSFWKKRKEKNESLRQERGFKTSDKLWQEREGKGGGKEAAWGAVITVQVYQSRSPSNRKRLKGKTPEKWQNRYFAQNKELCCVLLIIAKVWEEHECSTGRSQWKGCRPPEGHPRTKERWLKLKLVLPFHFHRFFRRQISPQFIQLGKAVLANEQQHSVGTK